jgi:hypothetical protein
VTVFSKAALVLFDNVCIETGGLAAMCEYSIMSWATLVHPVPKTIATRGINTAFMVPLLEPIALLRK